MIPILLFGVLLLIRSVRYGVSISMNGLVYAADVRCLKGVRSDMLCSTVCEAISWRTLC